MQKPDDTFDSFPEYLCHKKVRAVQIAIIEQVALKDTEFDKDGKPLLEGGSYWIYPEPSETQSYKPFQVSAKFYDRHKPKAGGYFVVYEDGYCSFSPEVSFKNGYTEVQP